MRPAFQRLPHSLSRPPQRATSHVSPPPHPSVCTRLCGWPNGSVTGAVTRFVCRRDTGRCSITKFSDDSLCGSRHTSKTILYVILLPSAASILSVLSPIHDGAGTPSQDCRRRFGMPPIAYRHCVVTSPASNSADRHAARRSTTLKTSLVLLRLRVRNRLDRHLAKNSGSKCGCVYK